MVRGALEKTKQADGWGVWGLETGSLVALHMVFRERCELCEESILGRENGKCKGPGAGSHFEMDL